MPINQSNQVDYLFKKIGYGVTTTANANVKSPSNETIASPLTLRGDIIWLTSNQIPTTQPGASAGVVTVYSDANANSVKATNDGTAPPYQTWKTGIVNWIDPSFGSTYAVKVYWDSTASSTPQSTGTQLFPDGTGADDEWFFDYNSGVLTFPDNIPSAVNGVTGKTIFIIGATFTGTIGLANIASVITGTVNTANVAILSNVIQVNDANIYYPALYSSNAGGNLASYVSSNVFYEPDVGNLTLHSNVLASTFYGNVVGFQANITGNLYAGNIYIIGAQTLTDMTASGNISANNIIAQSKIIGTLYGNVIGTTGTFSSNLYANNFDGNVHGNIYTDYIGSDLTNVVTFSIPTAIGLPTGGDATRPGTAAAGQLRYNSDRATLEFYNGSGWVDLTAIITVQQFNGDGVNTTYNLNSLVASSAAILVNINGTVQQPDIAYSVATVGGVSQINFAETPQTTDAIDIRFLSTGAETVDLSKYKGNVGIQGGLGLQGNIIPSSTNAYTIGNVTNQWNSVYSNAITVTSGVYWANGVPFASSTYSNANVTIYLPTDATIQSIQANLGAYQTYANANIGTLYNNNISIQANLGAYQIYANANIGTLYNNNISTQANLGAYQIYANANAVSQALAITSLATNANANTAAYLSTATIVTTGNIQAGNITVTGNITSVNYETITYTEIANVISASGNISTTANLLATNYLYSNGVNILNSVGSYQIYANANIGTLYLGNISTQSNLGAYQIYANANIGTLYNNNISTQANLGAYQIYANANTGAYQTWANATIASLTYSNANVIANLQHLTSNISTTGNISTNNLTITGLTTIQQTREVFTNVAITSANTVTLNYNNGTIFYCNSTAATGNFSANFTNFPTTSGYIVATTVIIPKSVTNLLPTVVNINGVTSTTVQWQSGAIPTTLNNNTNIISFTFINLGLNTYTVLGSYTGYS